MDWAVEKILEYLFGKMDEKDFESWWEIAQLRVVEDVNWEIFFF